MFSHSLFFLYFLLQKKENSEMGETDEKENVPAGTPTAEIEEPKETEKLLNNDEKKGETEKQSETKPEKEPVAEETKPVEEAPSKVNGEEVIAIPDEAKPEKKPKEDGREVKPKKIPIGGIKMPGFFTRKPKPTENDGAEGELLDNAGNETKAEEPATTEPVAPASTRPSFLASLPALPPLPKFRNPFAKKAAAPKDEETGDATKEETPEGDSGPKTGKRL